MELPGTSELTGHLARRGGASAKLPRLLYELGALPTDPEFKELMLNLLGLMFGSAACNWCISNRTAGFRHWRGLAKRHLTWPRSPRARLSTARQMPSL